jgi:phage terminase large subunit-like protein
MVTATNELNVPLTFGYKQQMDFVTAEEPFVAFVAGVGAGKTHAGVGKALIYAVRHPGSLGMVTAPTYGMLMDATFRKFQEIVPREAYSWHVGEKRIQMINGSEILWRSTDDPEHLRGPTLDWAHMDEADRSPLEAFNILMERLRPYEKTKQLWITTTPRGFNWVYHTFAKEVRPGYREIHCSARDNIYLDCKMRGEREHSSLCRRSKASIPL